MVSQVALRQSRYIEIGSPRTVTTDLEKIREKKHDVESMRIE
jgi:hypothetical protein